MSKRNICVFDFEVNFETKMWKLRVSHWWCCSMTRSSPVGHTTLSLLSTELNWKRSAAARSNTHTHKKLQSFPARFSLFSDGLVSPWLLHTHSSVTHFIKNTWNHSFPSPRSHPFIFSSLTADRLMNQRQDGSTTHDWQEVSASDGDGESHLKSLSATRLLNERRRGS